MELPEVAIPSYKRSNSISHKTLAFLSSVAYPADKITIFVANEEEAQIYYKAVPRTLYGKLVVGIKGLMEQRAFISNYYPEDTILIQMDDDVKKIDSPVPFLTLIQNAVELLEKKKGGLWGVMPNDDKRRYKDSTTTHLTHILGSFFVCRNHRDIVITATEKEDYERSILYFLKYGEVYRYRGAGVSTTYNVGGGGLQGEGRVSKMEHDVKNLLKLYPLYCLRKDKKGMPDMSLNWRAKKS
jgi:hypothetical protein